MAFFVSVNAYSIEFSQFPERVSHPGADFAGKYQIIVDGCGTQCQRIIALDLVTNEERVLVLSENGVCYQKDSRLMVVNPITEDTVSDYGGSIPAWLTTKYYVLNGDEKLILAQTSKAVTEVDCDD